MGLAATAAGALGSASLFGCEMHAHSEAAPPPPPPPSAGPAPGAEAGAPPPGPGGAAKQSKAEAMYQDHPNGTKHCSACANFVAPNDCKVIQGPVSPNGYCKNFRARG